MDSFFVLLRDIRAFFEQVVDEIYRVVKCEAVFEHYRHHVDCRRNAVDAVLFYVQDGFCDSFCGAENLVRVEFFFFIVKSRGVENLTVENPRHNHYGDMKARYAHKVWIKRVDKAEMPVFEVFRAVCCGHAERIYVIGDFVAVSEFSEDIGGDFCAFFSVEPGKAESEGAGERMNEIQISGDSFRLERNGLVELVIDMDDRDFADFEFYAELEHEKLTHGCVHAFHKRDECARTEPKIKVSF